MWCSRLSYAIRNERPIISQDVDYRSSELANSSDRQQLFLTTTGVARERPRHWLLIGQLALPYGISSWAIAEDAEGFDERC